MYYNYNNSNDDDNSFNLCVISMEALYCLAASRGNLSVHKRAIFFTTLPAYTHDAVQQYGLEFHTDAPRLATPTPCTLFAV